MISSLPQPPALWPSISESHAEDEIEGDDNPDESVTEDWEFVTPTPFIENPPPTSTITAALRKMKHCASSPDFGTIYFQEETDSGSEGTESVSSHVLVSSDPQSSMSNEKFVGVRRVPSFKDIILLNAEKEKEEQEKKKEEENVIKSPKQRPLVRSRLVVKGIKRCIRSTPDLTSLASVDEDDYACGGGGGGGHNDANDFYARKNHGAVTRKNGQKLRPDEAKRKEFIKFKKDAQRQQKT